MIDTDDIDDVQAALIDRRIGHAFAFARVAVDDLAIMDVFEDGSDLDIKDIVPSPRIPEHAFIVEGNTQTGESVKVAVGVCVCNANHDVAKASSGCALASVGFAPIVVASMCSMESASPSPKARMR